MLVAFFLGSSAKPSEDACIRPRLFELLDQRVSPVRLAKQHLANLAFGNPDQLVLMWGLVPNAQCFDDLFLLRPELATRFMATVKALAGSLHARFLRVEEDPTLTVCLLVAPSVPRWQRFEKAKELWGKPECCLRGVWPLVTRWATADDAFLKDQQQIISGYHLALEELLSIADMERRHKRSN